MEQVNIRVREQIDEGWADWLNGLAIAHTSEGGSTISGRIRDQSALYGLLIKIRDLGLSLAAVTCEKDCSAGADPRRDAA